MVSIYDIAKRANVSPSTVSRALSNRGRISPATRRRIERLAEEMGYRPNPVARSLAGEGSGLLGVVIHDIDDPFVMAQLKAIENEANKRGLNVLVASTHARPVKQRDIVEMMIARKVDGMVVISSHFDEYLELSHVTIPVAILHTSEYAVQPPGVQLIASDEPEAMRKAIRHLGDLGHRRIAYLSRSRGGSADERRMAGYRRGVDEIDGDTDTDLVVVPADGDSDLVAGAKAIEQIMSLGVTAVACFNDMTAIGLLGAAHRHGVRVPQDISVVGFDDIELAAHTTPTLTTVAQHAGKIALAGVRAVIESASFDESLIVFHCTLVVRESTGPVSLPAMAAPVDPAAGAR
jgi:DNA-binding LacI/PurR family transcriptional regulator